MACAPTLWLRSAPDVGVPCRASCMALAGLIGLIGWTTVSSIRASASGSERGNSVSRRRKVHTRRATSRNRSREAVHVTCRPHAAVCKLYMSRTDNTVRYSAWERARAQRRAAARDVTNVCRRGSTRDTHAHAHGTVEPRTDHPLRTTARTKSKDSGHRSMGQQVGACPFSALQRGLRSRPAQRPPAPGAAATSAARTG